MKKARRLSIAAMFLMSIGYLTGCQRIELRPIKTLDIARLQQGTIFTAPIDGYFLSDAYMKEILKLKVRD